MEERLSRVRRRVRALGAMIVSAAAVVWGGVSIPVQTAQANTPTDLTVTLVTPVSATANTSFSFQGAVRNVSRQAVSNATLSFEISPGTRNLNVSCDASGGAVCPPNFQIRQASSSTPGTATATIPSLPAGAHLTLTFTGTYPNTSSVNAKLRADVPTGFVDTDPETNEVSQNVALEPLAHRISVEKVQDKPVVASGETRTYTVTYTNTGNATAVVRLRDLLRPYVPDVLPNTQYNGQTLSGRGGTVTSLTTKWSVSCNSEASTPGVCPTGFDGRSAEAVINPNPGEQFLYETDQPVRTNPSYPYDRNVQNATLPVGAKVVLTVPVTTTLNSCIANGSFVAVRNVASALAAPNTGTFFQPVEASVLGAIVGEECRSTTVEVTKTQDKTVVSSGETRVYTLTYANTGSADAVIRLRDTYRPESNVRLPDITHNGQQYSGLGGTVTGASTTWSISCDPNETTQGVCPAGFDGRETSVAGTATSSLLSTGATAGTDGTNPYAALPDVTIPAGAKLVLKVPVTTTLQSCIAGKRFVVADNIAQSSFPPGAPVVFQAGGSRVLGAIVGQECPSTTIEVTKTQDKAVVVSGETRTYTVTYANTGAHDAMVRLRDRYAPNSFTSLPRLEYNERILRGAGGRPTHSNVSWSVTCDREASTPGLCPTVFNGHTVAPRRVTGASYEDMYRSTNTPMQNPSVPYVATFSDVLLPAGAKLVLKVPVKTELGQCVPNSAFVVHENVAIASPIPGSGVTFPEQSSTAFGAIVCNDAAVTISVAPAGQAEVGQVDAGTPIDLMVKTANSVGLLGEAGFRLQLPATGIMSPSDVAAAVAAGDLPAGSQALDFACSVKRPNGAIETVDCPADLAYHADTHQISGKWIRAIVKDEELIVTVKAFAGLQPRDYQRSYLASAQLFDIAGDVNESSNSASNTFAVVNAALAGPFPTPMLPMTGGKAADAFTLFGSATVVLALAVAWLLRRRLREEGPPTIETT